MIVKKKSTSTSRRALGYVDPESTSWNFHELLDHMSPGLRTNFPTTFKTEIEGSHKLTQKGP